MTPLHRLAERTRRSALALRPLILALAVALTGAPAAVAAQSTAHVLSPTAAPHADAVERARELALTAIAEENLPGLSAAVGIDGEIVWAEGFGWADIEQRVPVTALTRFRIGSVSKPLTATAIGLLIERGRVDLDAPVQTYVPDFPEKRWPITTRRLMGHTAGIRHYRGDEFLSDDHYAEVMDGLEIFADDTLLFRPGTDYSYSSYGWNLVSAVVQSAADEPFLDFMRREVFAPLGLRHTVPDFVADIIPDRVAYYVHDDEDRLRNAPWVDNSYKWAGGGFLSTPSDLVRFGFAMLDAELLERETVDLLWTPLTLESGESTGYGLGWSVDEEDGRRVVSHGGGSVGGTTGFLIFPEERIVIAVTSNLSNADIGSFGRGLVEIFAPAGTTDGRDR